MQAQPTRAPAQKGERNLYCTNYNACISEVLRAGWDGFSCEKCPLRSRDSAPRADTFAGRNTSPMDCPQ